MLSSALESMPIVRWYLEHLPNSVPVDEVTTLGGGPVAEEEWDTILGEAGVQPFAMSRHSDLVVVGREGWEPEELDDLMDQRAGLTLRVHSQEMFVSYLLTGSDPLDADEDVLEAFIAGHPALEYLSEVGFTWPSTEVWPGFADSEIEMDRPEQGLLSLLGYSVAAKGPSTVERRRILRRAFTEEIPTRGLTDEYVKEWGRPSTGGRLKKLATTIAGLCRLAKRQTAPRDRAIQKWESDLAWLKTEYYDNRPTFGWPRT